MKKIISKSIAAVFNRLVAAIFLFIATAFWFAAVFGG